MTRSRGGLAIALVVLVLVLVRSGVGSPLSVPAELQAELLSKLAPYDRNFEARAGSEAVLVLLVRPKDAQSAAAGAIMKSALSRMERVGGRPHREIVLPFQSAEALAKTCQAEHVAVVYVTPGFDDQVESLGKGLVGVNVLTVSAVSEYVPRGLVLGFELVSGKPKIVLNLSQAKSQNVNFTSDVLKLMKVYR